MYPIVIIGGFLSYASMYRSFRDELAAVTGQPVYVVNIQGYDWIPAVSRLGWVRLLDILDWTVREAVRLSTTGKVILVGHSAGGVLSRLYLSPRSFLGRIYPGLRCVDRLFTLGSPHYSKGGLRRGGHMSEWIEQRYPGAYFSPLVKYISVASKYVYGDINSQGFSRWAYKTYRSISGDGAVWGDGLIPVDASLLMGSEHVILEGVSHYSVFGTPWYGSKEVIPAWWIAPAERAIHTE